MELTVEQVYKHIDKFTNVYKNGKEVALVPKGVKVTVYCESKTEEGFLLNQTDEEIGFAMLIVKKWILESELQELCSA